MNQDEILASMIQEAKTEATCQVCGQKTTLNMLTNGVHYSANLCQMFRQRR